MGIKVKSRAVFLDRDGVLNKAVVVNGNPYPPASLETLELDDYAIEGVALLKNMGFLTIVVTNQPDIARGSKDIANVEIINDFLKKKLGIDAIYICPHDDQDHCDCRKPKPGLILRAKIDFPILDIENSYMIGDRWRDIEAGVAAKCHTIFIDYGYKEEKKVTSAKTVYTFKEAVNYIRKLDNERE